MSDAEFVVLKNAIGAAIMLIAVVGFVYERRRAASCDTQPKAGEK